MTARTTHQTDRRTATPAGSVQPLRLLLVDDDVNYRTYVASLTRRLGFWVDAADHGEAALDRLSHGAYDLVIVDYEMPRMSGVETIRRIREQEPTRDLYALMLTGREDVDTKLTALDAGFDDFVTKTSSEPELVAKLVAARRLAARQRSMDVAIRDLYTLSTRDDLTGVFNRRFFISEAERMLAERIPVSVILLDLDGFKMINDTFGHLMGDGVLRDVATALHANTRAEDIVARFGGDEFVIALPQIDVATVERIAERVREAVAALRWGTPSFAIGMSAGIAFSHLLPNPTLVQLVSVADRDMYKNKWLRKHPGVRPELYEYPAENRDLVERLFSAPHAAN
ncbi:MAG TPA: diguanylate cyclase [Thermoanaerobaculia bacterium]|nr:diguanylate cyclase [Thermoanaerobaculia bacterium]